MAKKVIGILFFVAAALATIGAFATGNMESNLKSGAAAVGFYAGLLLPVVVYVLSGIFFLTFDKVYKLNYVNGFNARAKQCSKIVVFLVIYVVFLFFVGVGAGASGADNFILVFLVSALPYFIPVLIFAGALGMYAVPYWACKKQNDPTLNGQLSADEVFYTYADDDSVLASSKVLFFPRLFCAVPFETIASVKLVKTPFEKDVVFTLQNGKKLEMAIAQKQYDSIVAAINANAPQVTV